jgi:hypothetical protein
MATASRRWPVVLGLLLFAAVPVGIFLESLTIGAIWRGPGLEPVIHRASQPVD